MIANRLISKRDDTVTEQEYMGVSGLGAPFNITYSGGDDYGGT